MAVRIRKSTEQPAGGIRKVVAAKSKPAATKPKVIRRRAVSKTVVDKSPTDRLATVPDSKVAEMYIHRSFGAHTDFDVYDRARSKTWNVLIEGPTGAAKTTSVQAYAAARGLPFYSVSSSIGLEPSQLFGKFIPIPVAGGSFSVQWQDGPVTDLVRYGGVLLLNEVNFIPERVGSVLFSLLDRRREIQLVDHLGEIIVAHPDLLIVADMNPDYEGTRTLNKAFRNRFRIQLVWDYDPTVESTLITSKTLREIAGKLRGQNTIETPVSTNMLMEFEEHVVELDLQFAKLNFEAHFDSDERSTIRQILEMHSNQLRQDFDEDFRKAEQKRIDEEERRAAKQAEEQAAVNAGAADFAAASSPDKDWVYEDEVFES